MQVYDRFNQKEYWNYDRILQSQTWNDYDDFWEKYGLENEEAYAAFCSLGSYFDGLGVLIKRELIDISLVDDLLQTRLLWFWNKYGTIIEERRKRFNNPRVWPHITLLYDKLLEYLAEHPEVERWKDYEIFKESTFDISKKL